MRCSVVAYVYSVIVYKEVCGDFEYLRFNGEWFSSMVEGVGVAQ